MAGGPLSNHYSGGGRGGGVVCSELSDSVLMDFQWRPLHRAWHGTDEAHARDGDGIAGNTQRINRVDRARYPGVVSSQWRRGAGTAINSCPSPVSQPFQQAGCSLVRQGRRKQPPHSFHVRKHLPSSCGGSRAYVGHFAVITVCTLRLRGGRRGPRRVHTLCASGKWPLVTGLCAGRNADGVGATPQLFSERLCARAPFAFAGLMRKAFGRASSVPLRKAVRQLRLQVPRVPEAARVRVDCCGRFKAQN